MRRIKKSKYWRLKNKLIFKFILDVQNANKKGENKKISTFRSANITELIHHFVWAFMVRKYALILTTHT